MPQHRVPQSAQKLKWCLAVALTASVVAGCSTHGDGSNQTSMPASAPPAMTQLGRSDLQSSLTSLIRHSGLTAESVSCPSDLEATPGARVECVLDLSDYGEINSRVSVDAVYGDDLVYSTSPVLTAAQLAQQVRTTVAEDRPDITETTCAGDVDSAERIDTTCDITGSGDPLEVAVHVKNPSGFMLDIHIESIS